VVGDPPARRHRRPAEPDGLVDERGSRAVLDLPQQAEHEPVVERGAVGGAGGQRGERCAPAADGPVEVRPVLGKALTSSPP